MKPSYILLVIILIATAAASGQPLPGTQPPLERTPFRFPIQFTENQGQWDGDVLYASLRPRQIAYFTRQGLLYRDGTASQPATLNRENTPVSPFSASMEFVRPSSRMRIEAAGRTQTQSQFYYGNDSSAWREHVANYTELRYADVWPGIDVSFLEHEGKLRRIVKVRPEGRLTDVRFRETAYEAHYAGMTRAVVYEGGVTGEVPIAMKHSGDTVSYSLARKSAGAALEIITDFATFFGGSGDELIMGAALDDSNNIYFCGYTLSPDFPAMNAFQPVYHGAGDVFAARINCDGRTLGFSTYIGGSNVDETTVGGSGGVSSGARSHICVSPRNMIYVVGGTASTDFPIRGDIVQKNFWSEQVQGKRCGFIAQMSPDGRLERSTFLSGPGGLTLYSPSTDADGDLYVAGLVMEDSLWFITPGVVQPTVRYKGLPHGLPYIASVVAKLSLDLSQVKLATYLFAPNGDNSNAINVGVNLHLDRDENIVVSGGGWILSSAVASIPIVRSTVPDPLPKMLGFVTKLNSAATAYIFSMVFGSNYYVSNASYCDENGNLYITGMTDTAGFSYSRTYLTGKSYTDMFVSRYDSAGKWVFGTVVGGGGGDGRGITKDRCGNIVVNGIAGSTFPILRGNPTPGHDAEFVAAFDPDDGVLQYSSRIPGMSIVGTLSLLCDAAGNFVATSKSSDYDAQYFSVKDAIQNSSGGDYDGTITRFRLPLCQPFSCELRSTDTIRVTKKRRQVTPSRFTITLDLVNGDASQGATLVDGTLSLPPSVFLDPPAQTLTLSGITLGPGERRQFQWTAGVDSTKPPAGVNAIRFDASYRMQAQGSVCPLPISACSIDIVVVTTDDVEPLLSCRVSCIDTVHATPDGLSNADTPFPFSFIVRNDDAGPVRIDSVRLLPPKGMGVETFPAGDEHRPGAVLPPGGELPCAWSLTVHPRALPRTITIAAIAYDHYGIAVARCERLVVIEPVPGLRCHVTGPPVIRCNGSTGETSPDTVTITAMLENTLDTLQIVPSAALDLTAAQHLAFVAGETPEKGPAQLAERFKRYFRWKLVTMPFTTGGVETPVFRYRAAVDSTRRSCELAIPTEVVRYRLSCTLGLPDTLRARDTAYAGNPFRIVCDITNTGQAASLEATARMVLDSVTLGTDALQCLDPPVVAVPAIDPGTSRRVEWSILARGSRFDRTAAVAVIVTDSLGTELTRCGGTLVLPPIVPDLRCSLETSDTLHYDLPSDTYTPDPFPATLTLANVLDTAQAAIDTELDLTAAPHLMLDAGEIAGKTLDSIPAHAQATLAWRIALVLRSDSAIVERITVRYRHASDSAAAGGGWLACSKDIVIEGGKRIIAASCAVAGHDTLWADVAYEDVIPHPVQVQYTITNTGTVPLAACTAAIVHPPALTLVNPSDSIQDYGTIPPGASAAREWLLVLDQSQAQPGAMQLSWNRGCLNLAGDSACTHRVTLIAGPPPGIVLSPWLLRFRAQRHAALPASQTVTLWTGGALAMPWQLQPSVSWLDVQPLAGSTKQIVSVQPNTTDLQDGSYPATIDVASNAMVAPPRVEVIYEIGTLNAVDAPASPDGIELESPYPNPAHGTAIVAFTVASARAVQLTLYDIYGRRAATLADGSFTSGRHVIRTDLSTLPPGVYVCVLNAGGACATRRMVLRK